MVKIMYKLNKFILYNKPTNLNVNSKEEDLPYLPSYAESSMSDDNSDEEINNEEVIDLVRKSSKVTCMGNLWKVVTLASLSSPEEHFSPKEKEYVG